ncbi:endo alpha-1,4 polygalactosaminidase [Kineococcus terrestris]|uniref:endo alpha-1,4 polygalactosaminidase n=1 Tax=Kineococcus terrestris TaxID=2044856 RepID=UPI0034DB43E1
MSQRDTPSHGRGGRRRALRAAASALVAGALLAATAVPSLAAPTGSTRSTALTGPTGSAERSVLLPPLEGTADYQIGGAYPPAAGVSVVVRDRAERPAPGVYSVCYVNAFQTQPGERARWRPELLLRDRTGTPVRDADWPDEVLLDTSGPAQRAGIAAVVGPWLDDCAARGFRAVELDNLDSWTRSGGRLTQRDALALAGLLARRAHAAGLAVAQKNAPETTREQARAAGFDFAVAEDCERHRECGAYTAVHGRRVLEVEHTDGGRAAFERACRVRGGTVHVVLRDRDVLPRGRGGHVSASC